jgi:hypothetical protein
LAVEPRQCTGAESDFGPPVLAGEGGKKKKKKKKNNN